MSHRQPLSLTITSSRFAGEPGTKTYTLYLIQVRRGNEEGWTVERRYSDFVHLKEGVQSACSGLPLSLPPKKLSGNLNVAFVAKRLEGLQAFLDVLQQYPAVMRLPAVLEFFNAPEACEAFREQLLVEVLTFVRNEPDYELNERLFLIGARQNKGFARLQNLRDRSRTMLSITQVSAINGILEDSLRVALAWLPAGVELAPFFVKLRKATISGGALATFTDYFELGSLKDVIYRCKPEKRCADKYRESPRRPLPDSNVRRFGRQVLLCLAALHRMGLAHGHVHTGNMLVTEEADKTRTVKLTPIDALICCVPPQRLFLLRRFPHVRDAPAADIVMLGYALIEMATGVELWADTVPNSIQAGPLRTVLDAIFDKTRAPPTAAELLADEYFAVPEGSGNGGATQSPPTSIAAPAKVKETIRLALEAYQKMILLRAADGKP